MSLAAWNREGDDAKPVGEIAKALLKRKRFHEKGKFAALEGVWRALLGEAVAARTHIRSFKDGILVIEVDSSVLLHELRGFMKQQILLGLQATAAGRDIADIQMRLGLPQGGGRAKEADPRGL